MLSKRFHLISSRPGDRTPAVPDISIDLGEMMGRHLETLLLLSTDVRFWTLDSGTGDTVLIRDQVRKVNIRGGQNSNLIKED